MKKSFLIILFMFLSLSFVIFTGCKDPEPQHEHTYSDSWTKDATHHWHASTCGHEVTEGKAVHTFGDWTTTKEATEEETGTREKSCTVCGYKVTEAIEKLAHTHKFAEEWTSDSSGHWHASTCGHEVTEGKAAHTFGNWTTTKEATEEVEGTREKSCTVCGYKVTEAIAKLAHTHKFATDWTKDGTYHWHAATCEHATEVSGKAAHSFGNWTTTKEATEEAEGSRERSCTVCGYTVTEVIEKLAHTHKFATDWTKDETNHWHASTCGHEVTKGKAAHTFGDYVSNNDSTTEADGTKTRECSVCGYKDTVTDEGSKIIEIYSVKLETTIVGETYTGTIPVTITGINLLAYDITSQDSNLSNINYISNTEATAEIDCNNSVGSHLVTINCGKATGTATYNVIEAEKCFAVGDILFTNGTRVKVEDVQYGVPDEQISKAFGVIASTTYGGGVGKAVGLQKGANLQWAPSGTTGYNTNFTEIQGTTTSGDMDGSDNWEYICSKDPAGSQNAATNYPAFNFANTYGTTAGLTDTDYADGWYLPSIAELKSVYDNRHIVGESLSAVGGAETFGGSYYCSSSQSSSNGRFAYALDFDDGSVISASSYTKSSNYSVLVVQALTSKQFNNYVVGYKGTSISDVKIASAGEGYTGKLHVTITGTNLKDQPITCSDASFDNLTYQSNTVATATIDCDGVVGEKSISFYCGSSVVTQTAKVLSSSNCITSADIGKIVLSDGSFVSKDSFNSSTMTPIAVVVGSKYNGGQAIAVGLQKGIAMWARSGTTGLSTNFTGIQGTTTSGDMDGADNWAYICNEDPQATVYPATNYPAFNYANNYGITAGLVDTDYADGWYLPSIAELDAVYDNKSTIQNSLDVVGGFTIGTSYYWSSSQSSSNRGFVYVLNFDDGSVSDSNKKYNSYVLVVQAFNAQ